jgi:hypothetical protein
MTERNYSPYQQKIINRYYANQPTLARQRLAELVGDLFLAEGKKKQQLWTSAVELMQKLEVPQSRIDHLLQKADATLLAQLVKEWESKPG